MVRPIHVRLLSALAVLMLLGGAVAAVLVACDLPLDPYAVGLPSGKTQFDGWVETPPGDQPGGATKTGFVVVKAGESIDWEMYYDPTQGGKNMKNLKFTKGFPAGVSNFEIKPGFTCDLFPLSVAGIVLQGAFDSNMNIEEVYNRDLVNGPWNKPENINRVYSPWRIPDNTGIVMRDNPPGPAIPFNPVIAITGSSNVTTKLPSDPAMLTDLFGANGYTPYQADTSAMTTASPPFWQVKTSPPPRWVGKGGFWSFRDVQATWEFNTRNTAGPAPANSSAINVSRIFPTPSEPYFYRVKPKALFLFDLKMAAGDRYEWTEQQMKMTTSGPVPTGLENPMSLTATGPIAKSNAGLDGGVSTLVLVTDENPPSQAYIKTAAAFTAPTMGDRVTGGDIKVAIVDDNPYGSTPATEPLPQVYVRDGTSLPPALAPYPGNYNVAKRKAELFYAMPVDDYGVSDLNKLAGGVPGDFTDSTVPLDAKAIQFPFHIERFLWFKKDLADPGASPGGSYVSGAGSPVVGTLTPYGNNANPQFSAKEWTIKAADIEMPVSIFHKEGSNDETYVDAPDGYKKWDHRLKFFVTPTDASGHKAPLADFPQSPEQIRPKSTAAAKETPGPIADVAAFGESGAAIPAAATPFDFRNAAAALAGGAYSGTPTNLATYGFINTLEDKVRPSVVVLVKDTKYNQTYVFNEAKQGWWARPEAQAAIGGAPPAGPATPPNVTAVADAMTSYNVPWVGVLGPDTDKIEFNSGGAFANVAAEFTAQVGAGFNPGAGLKGLWVDEDTRLLFQVLAWDNVNWRTLLPTDKVTWKFKDEPSNEPSVTEANVPDLGTNKFEYVFRNPNRSATVSTGECSLTVDVDDQATPANRRQIVIQFFVASNQLKILTLEESRRNK